jgi:hypothetical protein
MFFAFLEIASADSWWGYGYRDKAWVLKHGGSLIRFEIYNREGESDEYKAVLTKKGKNIEVEIGKSGIFDDALPGEYKVTFYRGGNKRKSFDEKGKEIDSIKLNIHAGEQIWLKLNYKKKKISMTTDYVQPVAKIKKTVTADTQQESIQPSEQKLGQQEEVQENNVEGQVEDTEFSMNFENIIFKDENYLWDNSFDIFHPNAYAKETYNKETIKPAELIANHKANSFFKKILFSVAEFLKRLF